MKTNRHMLAVTIINFILQFFYAWMVVYTPIYLFVHIGLSWSQIGIIFAVMLSPFVIFNLPIGILIDKYHFSKKTLLYIGFTIISIIETTSEIYFFSHVREEESHLLSVFRDMVPVAYIIAPIISTVIFVFLPFKYLFAVLAVILLSGLYYIPHLKHNDLTHSNENFLPDTNK